MPQLTHWLPMCDTVGEVKKKVDVNSTMILVSHAGVLTAAMEAIENRIPLVVVVTEFAPFHDTVKIRRDAWDRNIQLIGRPQYRWGYWFRRFRIGSFETGTNEKSRQHNPQRS